LEQGQETHQGFHATDCATFHGEFDGWTKERRDPYVANLLPIIPAHEMAGVVIGVQLKDLAAEMKECAELIEMFGTPYTACFQWAISIIMEIATERGSGERMAFVHEVNDYKGEALKAFSYVNEFLNPRSIPMTMGFGSKADFPPGCRCAGVRGREISQKPGGHATPRLDRAGPRQNANNRASICQGQYANAYFALGGFPGAFAVAGLGRQGREMTFLKALSARASVSSASASREA
jgi:hypothetical protein